MSEERRRGLDLTKKDESIVNDEFLGGARKKTRTGFVTKLIVAVVGMLGLLVTYMLLGMNDEASEPVKPAGRVERSTRNPQSTREADPVEALAKFEAAEKIRRDKLDLARDKVCRSLASELIDMPSPTQEQMRRTLLVYNVNKCSNEYIRNQDAQNRGLTKDELEALVNDTDVGPLRFEDK